MILRSLYKRKRMHAKALCTCIDHALHGTGCCRCAHSAFVHHLWCCVIIPSSLHFRILDPPLATCPNLQGDFGRGCGRGKGNIRGSVTFVFLRRSFATCWQWIASMTLSYSALMGHQLHSCCQTSPGMDQ